MRFALLVILCFAIWQRPALAKDENVKCHPDMSKAQCSAWQKFWPEFKASVAQEEKATAVEPQKMLTNEEESRKFVTEREQNIEAARAKVANYASFPFQDHWRTSDTEHGFPVKAENRQEFIKFYEYIFLGRAKNAIAGDQYGCDSCGRDGGKYDCNHVVIMPKLDDYPNFSGLMVTYEKDGRYYLTGTAYCPE